jgi:putative heme-binding domain-containing protein
LRDEPAARSVPLLEKIAAKFDGRDRAYLEAVGLGSEGKESAVYAQIAKTFAKNPEDWDAPAEWLTWRLHPAEATAAITTRAQSQRITPEQRNLMLTALAFTPTKEAADGMISIAANKQSDTAAASLWWLLHRKNNDWQAFDIAATLKSRGIHDPGAIKLVSVELPPSTPAATPFPAVQEILRLKGDVNRGRTAVGACYACHKIADQGTEFGPTLTEYAKQQTPETIIEAISKPSATISHGYEGSTVVTKDGTSITGIVQGNGDPVIIKSMGNLTQQVPREIVGSLKKLNRSLMYDPEQLGLTGQSVADIVAYLKSL